jgi:hypothetical protein
MRHVAGALVAVFLVALPAVALDLGRAEGNLTIDGKKIPLNYAYAIARQKNQLTDRNEMTRIILTDKPLPDGAKLAGLDDTLPGDLTASSSPSTSWDALATWPSNTLPATTTAATSRGFRTTNSSRARASPKRSAAPYRRCA